MNENVGKKLSFSFSKVKKRPISIAGNNKVNENVQYISSIEDKKLKLINGEENKEKTILVIPTQPDKVNEIAVKRKKLLNDLNTNDNDETKTLGNRDELRELAIRDLLKNPDEPQLTNNKSQIEIATSQVSSGENSSLKDYEDVPIEEFGSAMLRGMGWSPDKGVGKQGRVTQLSIPKLRPRGMGLGVNITNKNALFKSDCQVVPGALVKILLGTYKNNVGQVVGFCDSTGRITVKLARDQSIITINELGVEVISRKHYENAKNK